MAMSATMAEMEQREGGALPKKISKPRQKRSVLLCLMPTFIKEGEEWESRATSARVG